MRIFVFGSNESGKHDSGAARFAIQGYGAIQGVGFGMQGTSFAIPTKDWAMKTLPLKIISHYVDRFIAFANLHKDMRFDLTKIGCGLAGYSEDEIAPLFINAPDNVHLINKQYQNICLARDWYKNITEMS